METAQLDPKSQAKTTVYFDGLCRACSMEIEHYRKQKGSERIEFVDIMNPAFDAETHGLDPRKVHKVMHVRSSDGVLHEGVDAFRAIWAELPRYRFMTKVADSRAVRPLLEAGYRFFVVIRPYLPRKKAECSASPYCELPR